MAEDNLLYFHEDNYFSVPKNRKNSIIFKKK